jgi:hypothetical protein
VEFPFSTNTILPQLSYDKANFHYINYHSTSITALVLFNYRVFTPAQGLTNKVHRTEKVNKRHDQRRISSPLCSLRTSYIFSFSLVRFSRVLASAIQLPRAGV